MVRHTFVGEKRTALIRRLKIHNYAIIEDVEIDFAPQLIVITGETGAGKSILLGALNLVLGQRADTKSLGRPDEKCVVEAEFVLHNAELKPFFEEHDLDFDPELILRREISAQGKSRAFINDTPVTLDILQTISHALIDIHQQFDTLDIYNVSTQLKMIDALAGNQALLKQYQSAYKKYKADRKIKEEWLEALNKQKQEEEFVRFQYKELDEAQLIDGELQSLEQAQKELAHAGEIKEITALFTAATTEQDLAIVARLHDLDRKVQHLIPYQRSFKNISDRINSVILELEDLSAECETIHDEMEADPKRLTHIEDRLSVLYRLMHKHKVDHPDRLIALKAAFLAKLVSTDDLEVKIEDLERSILLQEKALYAIAESLHQNRELVIPGFIDDIYTLLHPLGMEQTRIKIQLSRATNLLLTGYDEMEFLLATNKGGTFLPIKNIASGGELARFNLVTKSLVAQAIPLPTLIFDEIDIGISGDVALKMGQILRNLAANHQVICITHSPQIAAKGEVHYYVFKDDSTDRTLAQVKKLNKSERVQVIATMLSSNPPSASAMKNAKELIMHDE